MEVTKSILRSISISTPPEITPQAEPQLRELGAALSDPKLKGATISINGHTDGVGGDAFNKRLSERRAGMIKEYLMDNFQLRRHGERPAML
jgi:OOP family OmpA-OmpF porin